MERFNCASFIFADHDCQQHWWHWKCQLHKFSLQVPCRSGRGADTLLSAACHRCWCNGIQIPKQNQEYAAVSTRKEPEEGGLYRDTRWWFPSLYNLMPRPVNRTDPYLWKPEQSSSPTQQTPSKPEQVSHTWGILRLFWLAGSFLF